MEWMDEFDPDWVGDPRISTLKRMAFAAKLDIAMLQDSHSRESGARVGKNITHDEQIRSLQESIAYLSRENSISNLYFQDLISKEEAKRLWDLYNSPDEDDHRVADAAITQLTSKQYNG